MARQEGIIKFSGELDGMVAYKLNGKWVMRKKGTISKKRYAKDPSFDQMRRSNKEFGGASTIAKSLRAPWKVYINKCKDNSMHHRLNSLILEFIKRGEGTSGQRMCSWNDISENLTPFKINNALPLNNYLNSDLDISMTNNSISWEINNLMLSKAPQGATHFKLITLISQIPAFHFSTTSNKYEKDSTPLSNIELSSDPNPINEPLNLSLTNVIETVEMSFFTIAQGIIFYQLVNNNYETLSELPFEWTSIRST